VFFAMFVLTRFALHELLQRTVTNVGGSELYVAAAVRRG
jgi:hypothetical protein